MDGFYALNISELVLAIDCLIGHAYRLVFFIQYKKTEPTNDSSIV